MLIRDNKGRFVRGGAGHAMPHTVEAKMKMSIAKRGRRSSPETEFKKGQVPWNRGLKGVQQPYWKGKLRLGMTGKYNPMWKGGITNVKLRIRNHQKMKEWRRSIFKRDGYKCVLCDNNTNDIQADHMYPFFRMFDDLSSKTLEAALTNNAFWDINNGRTLCINCHKKVKNISDIRRNEMTPTQRTFKYLKEKEYTASIVERWIKNPKHPAGGYRKDLFGIIDIIALTDKGIAGIQSCGSAFSEHNKKILNEPMGLKWIEKGGVLMLIGWRKLKLKRGGKAMRWQPRIKEYTVKDFTGGKRNE